MGYSIFDGITDLFSGGGKSTYDVLTGKYGDNVRDPGHFFTKSDSEKLADEQWEWQKEKYDENFQWQKDVFDYQQKLNAMQMEREDIAVQRRINDLKASGLSPTLAAGSAASVTPVHAGTAPQYEVGTNPKLEAAMFKEQMGKDRMALAMSVLSNMADVSRTKAETEFIKAKTGQQDIINKFENDMLSERLESNRLENIAKRMANSFNQLANPAKLTELRLGIEMAKKQIDIAELDKEIKTNEKLRQIYYNVEAKFKAALAGKEVELADLRKENIDWDTALKIYSLEYAIDNDVPLSGNLSVFGAVAGAASNLWHIFHK